MKHGRVSLKRITVFFLLKLKATYFEMMNIFRLPCVGCAYSLKMWDFFLGIALLFCLSVFLSVCSTQDSELVRRTRGRNGKFAEFVSHFMINGFTERCTRSPKYITHSPISSESWKMETTDWNENIFKAFLTG